MEEAVHKCVLVPRGVGAVAAELVQCLPVTVLVAKFSKHKVEKNFLDKAKMKKRFLNIAELVQGEKIEIGIGILTEKN